MHLGYYVRHHTLDDNGEVGGIDLAFAIDRNWRWRVRAFGRNAELRSHQAYILDKLNILPIESG